MSGWGEKIAGHPRGIQDAVRQIECSACRRKVRHDLAEYGICMRCLYHRRTRDPIAQGWRRGVTVLKSPHGEYAAGSRFDLASFRLTLAAGSMPLGMIIKRESGRIECVCGIGKAYRNPADEFPKQWLRRIA